MTRVNERSYEGDILQTTPTLTKSRKGELIRVRCIFHQFLIFRLYAPTYGFKPTTNLPSLNINHGQSIHSKIFEFHSLRKVKLPGV